MSFFTKSNSPGTSKGSGLPKSAKQPNQLNIDKMNIIFGRYEGDEDTMISRIIQESQKKFNAALAKEKSNSFFSGIPKGVFNLTQNLEDLIANYFLIISCFIKEKPQEKALKIFLFLIHQNEEGFKYIFEKIKKNLPLSAPNNNISKFYPSLTITFLKILSAMIKLSGKFQKKKSQATFIQYYLQILLCVGKLYKEKAEIRSRENEVLKKLKFFLSSTLFNCSLLTIWYYYPVVVPIKLLEKIKEYYFLSTSDPLGFEIQFLQKVYFNLGLLYYVNGEDNEAISMIENAKSRINKNVLIYQRQESPPISKKKTFGRINEISRINKRRSVSLKEDYMPNFLKKVKKIDVPIQDIAIAKDIEMALGEILFYKGDYLKSFSRFKEALDYIEAIETRQPDEVENKKDMRKVQTFIVEIDEIMNESSFKKEVNNDREERVSTTKIVMRQRARQAVQEIEKFFLFLTGLSSYQVKILNDFQPPEDARRNMLPILFPSQFKDCLTFSQRLSLDKLQTMGLLRQVLLKDPKKPICVSNINFQLFSLKEKTILLNETNDKVGKGKKVYEDENFNKFFDNLLEKTEKEGGDTEYLNKNKVRIRKVYENVTKNDLEEVLKNPLLVKESIKKGIQEEKNRQKKLREEDWGLKYYDDSSDSNDSDEKNDNDNKKEDESKKKEEKDEKEEKNENNEDDENKDEISKDIDSNSKIDSEENLNQTDTYSMSCYPQMSLEVDESTLHEQENDKIMKNN